MRTTFDYEGSGGAVGGFDGYQGCSSMSALGAVTRGNVEEEEIRLPWRILKYEFATDLTGAGRWRGGPGVHWEAQNEGSAGQMAADSSDGDVVQGGGAGYLRGCRRSRQPRDRHRGDKATQGRFVVRKCAQMRQST